MMKQKKIIVPILTLAVMLLMVGGVYTVFSSTQPEKSKAENVRDTTDQDYEKGLTEEQKAFNELINKQIYEETANNLEQYEQYGLTYNSDENQLFFNGKSVCYFADNRATDGTFEGTEVHSANGDIGIGLSDMEVSLVNVMAHEKIMEQALEPFEDKYDYCLIDCMPSLGIITVASLVAADRVLIPVQAQHFALKGLVSLFKSVNQVKRRINPRLDIDGIVLTMVDKRTNLSKDVCAALRSAYGHALKIYRAEIPVSTRTAESAASTHSVLTYDANGPASMAYKALAKEVTENERVRQQHQSALTR